MPERPIAEAHEGAALQAAKDGKTVGEIAELVRYEEERFKHDSATKCSIVTAAREGNIDAVARLLEAGADFTAYDGEKCSYSQPHTPLYTYVWDFPETALKAAVDGGHLEVLQRLLDAEKGLTSDPGFFIDAALKAAIATGKHQEVVRLQKVAKTLQRASGNKDMALIFATMVGNLQMMLSLTGAGANVDNSLLATASEAGHLDIVEFLLQTVDGGRGDAICEAAGAGQREVFERLVQDMVEVDSTSLDDALGSAVFKGDSAIIRRLLDLGASGNARYRHRDLYTEIMFYSLSKDPEGEQYDNWTVLQLAALRDDIDLAHTLLRAGADVNVCTDEEERGLTTLQVAAEHGSLALVQLLLAVGAQVNAPPPNRGYTALQSACRGGRDDNVRALLDAGAITDTDSTTQRGPSTRITSDLEWAALEGLETVVETLLESLPPDESLTNTIRLEALVSAIDTNHMTIAKRLLSTNIWFSEETKQRRLLPGAAKADDLDMVRVLLEARTNDKAPWTHKRDLALPFAVEHENLEIVKLLLAAGADANAVDDRQDPMLHIAAANGNMPMTQLLIDWDAKLTAISYTGTTALQAAERSGDAETVKLLKSRLPLIEGADTPQGNGSSLCPKCARIPLRVFLGTGDDFSEFLWHPSLTSLESSARNGCLFCAFFSRQLGIQNIPLDILQQPSRVPVPEHMSRLNDVMSCYISGAHPFGVSPGADKFIGNTYFHIIAAPFRGEYTQIACFTSQETSNRLSREKKTSHR